MRVLPRLGLCFLIAAGGLMAQRHGGGFRSGSGGFRGGVVSGGFRSGGTVRGGFRGGFGGFDRDDFGGFRGGFGGLYGGFGGYYSPYFYGYPLYALGFSDWMDSYDYPGYISTYPYITPYGDGYSNPAYNYNASPNVTVIYPPPAPAQPPVYVSSVPTHRGNYDEYGQPLQRSSPANASPIYLIALKDHTIYAASSYRVEGKTLHYVNLDNAAKQVPLDQVDRNFSMQLNQQRHVAFHLPVE